MQGGLRERNTSQPGPQDRRARRDFKILMLGPLTGLVTSDVLGCNPAAVCSKGPQESPTHSKEPGPLARGSELTGRSHLLRAKSVIQARSRQEPGSARLARKVGAASQGEACREQQREGAGTSLSLRGHCDWSPERLCVGLPLSPGKRVTARDMKQRGGRCPPFLLPPQL